MAWIESHQALGHHPKTLTLGVTLRCGVPTAVGYLHLLWWWALDYAPDGLIRADTQKAAARACYWHGAPARFWDALRTAGFVELETDGSLRIHDWREYAGRLLERRQKNAERMRSVRSTSGARAKHVQRYQPDQPDQPPVGPLTATLRSHAREPGPEGPLALHAAEQDDPTRLPNGAQQCPLCPDVFTTTYDEHLATSPRHKFRPEPEDFSGKRKLLPETPPGPPPAPQTAEALNREHERLLALDRQHLNHQAGGAQ